MPKPTRRRLLPRAASKFVPLLACVCSIGAAGFFGSAYVAWAGDATASESTSTGDTTTTAETTTAEPTPTQTTEPPPPPETPGPPGPPDEPTPTPDPPPPAPEPQHTAAAGTQHVDRSPGSDEGGHATLWIDRALPDPTPPTERLSPAFARELRKSSRAAGVRWSLVLAVVRVRGGEGAVPIRASALEHLVRRLAVLHAASDARRAVGALRQTGQDFTDRVLTLERYNRAVGLRALVHGLEWAKPLLERRILGDPRIDIYPSGRADLASGRINVRVSVVIRYLAIAFRQVTVSSLVSEHPFFARPSVVSAHIYGLAVDVSAVGGVAVIGHQEPGGLVEQAVAQVLLLPAEVQPKQVISLVGLGGPSFPLADHYDHIHIGY